MPVFNSAIKKMPAWCELEAFDIVVLEPGQVHQYERISKKEKLIIGRGSCHLVYAEQDIVAQEHSNLDLHNGSASFKVDKVTAPTTLIRMCGIWGDDLGGSGVFIGEESNSPQDNGDAVKYVKNTNFDCHYHDCDEYWILFEGSAQVYTEGKSYAVGVGDCVATGMGHHHDIAQVYAPLRAVYFETTMAGLKRRGHLWNHSHGPAQPQRERI